MSARIIHVGKDEWHRLSVLRRAGLSVQQCGSVEELSDILRTGTNPDAVVVSQSLSLNASAEPQAIKSLVSCPTILFPSDSYTSSRGCDLVIAPLTTPDLWLRQIWALILESRKVKAQSRKLRERSAELRHESAEARRVTRERIESGLSSE